MKKIKKSVLRKREKRKLKREAKSKLREWVKKIKERDNYSCQVCGKDVKYGAPQNCQAHHILDKKNYPELRTDVNNGITLCYRDHKVSKFAPHLNALSFIVWLIRHKPSQYFYLKNYLETR